MLAGTLCAWVDNNNDDDNIVGEGYTLAYSAIWHVSSIPLSNFIRLLQHTHQHTPRFLRRWHSVIQSLSLYTRFWIFQSDISVTNVWPLIEDIWLDARTEVKVCFCRIQPSIPYGSIFISLNFLIWFSNFSIKKIYSRFANSATLVGNNGPTIENHKFIKMKIKRAFA